MMLLLTVAVAATRLNAHFAIALCLLHARESAQWRWNYGNFLSQ
jgi:hypothetical protein